MVSLIIFELSLQEALCRHNTKNNKKRYLMQSAVHSDRPLCAQMLRNIIFQLSLQEALCSDNLKNDILYDRLCVQML